jgi:general secretion pathway protein I
MRGTWNRYMWGQGSRGEEVEQQEARNIANLDGFVHVFDYVLIPAACAIRMEMSGSSTGVRTAHATPRCLQERNENRGQSSEQAFFLSPAPSPQPLASRTGFTLLEVLVAMAVLSVALVGLLGLYNRSLLLTAQAQRLTTATLLAQEVLSRTQLEGINAIQPGAGDFADLHPGRYPEFRWYRAIQATPLEDLWEVRVGVAWGEREHEACELTLFMSLHRD